MKTNLLFNFLISFGLINLASAAKARYPVALDSDLKKMGEHDDYNNIIQIKITSEGSTGLCSAVRAENFYVTAAHCLQEVTNIEILSETRKEEKVIGYFNHPYYQENVINDLALFWTTLKETDGYAIATNIDVNSDFVSSGFGAMRNDAHHTKQTFDLCGQINFGKVLEKNVYLISDEFKSDEVYENKKCGLLTPGDSGGALLQRTGYGNMELAGISIRGDSWFVNKWRSIDSKFINAARKVVSENIDTLNSNVLEDHTSNVKDMFSSIAQYHMDDVNSIYMNANDALIKENYEAALYLYRMLGEECQLNRCFTFLTRAKAQGRKLDQNEYEACENVADAPADKSHNLNNLNNPIFPASVQYHFYELYAPSHLGEILYETMFPDTIKVRPTDKYLKKAAYGGSPSAIAKYLNSNDHNESIETIIELYSKAAQDGNTAFQYKLSMIYMPESMYDLIKAETKDKFLYLENKLREQANSIQKDCVRSLQFLKAAAEASYSTAEYALGALAIAGYTSCSAINSMTLFGDDKVSIEAIDLLTRASNEKNDAATDKLCQLYMKEGNSKANEYCLKATPAYVLVDTCGHEDKIAILNKIFKDVQQKHYLPGGEEAKKLAEIQSMFKHQLESSREGYDKQYSPEEIDLFVHTDLPELLPM